MSDYNEIKSSDELLEHTLKLEETIDKNNKELDELLSQGNTRLNRVVENVYKDFFGNDFVRKYNHDETASDHQALKNAIHNALYEETKNPSSPSISKEKGSLAAPSSENTDSKEHAAAEASAEAEKRPEKSGMEQLNELIGLQEVKKDVSELVNLMKIQKLREEKGMNYVPTSLHLVFSGNPGTGKTTVARILAQLYHEIGVLSKGQLVEVDRSGLVAGYVGQTALKTQEKIQEAMGGILFIDEAYALNKDGQDFGQEAIDTILKAMEDNRRDFIVIAAGYTKPMESFINSNPGLKSRFNKFICFPDYTADEMMSIFEMNCRKYSYQPTDEARAAVRAKIEEHESHKGENFANARDVRNLFEAMITNQASRIAAIENPTQEDITTLLPEDLDDVE